MPREAKKHLIDDLITKAKKANKAVTQTADNKPTVSKVEEQSFDPNRQTPHISPNGVVKRDGKKRFDF
jgi:hypothetical protein